MAKTIMFAKTLSRRTLSVVLACAVFAVMFLTVLTGAVLFSGAGNPSALEALNHEVPVQSINMMPTATGTAVYIENKGDGDKEYTADSRTTFAKVGNDNHADYLQVDEQGNGDVMISVKKEKPNTNSADTTYAWTYTQVNQMINLADNPYFSMSFDSSSVRVNGWFNFTITRDGVTYVINTANDTIAEMTDTSNLTPTNSQLANSGFDFYRIFDFRNDDHTIKTKADGSIEYAYNQHSGAGNKDFWVSSSRDETVDFYEYLYGYFKALGWIENYWPKWGTDGNYMTVTYVRHVVVSCGGADERGVGQPLRQGGFALWKTCSLGRTALTQADVLSPRIDEMVVPTNNDNQRRARLDDGRTVFRNFSTTGTATFQWDIKRFVNIVELQAMLFDAQFSGSGTFTMEIALLGRNGTKSSSGYDTHYATKGITLTLDYLIDGYSDQKGKASPAKYRDATINLKQAIDAFCAANKATNSNCVDFYPDDRLIGIREIKLTLPADSKLTINRFGVSIRNDFAASTTKNTVYPWATDIQADTLPPEGTPATSANLNAESGADSAVYNWAATSTPLVEHKVDLLAMTDQHQNYSNKGLFTGYDTTQATGYWRTLDGKSYFTSTTANLVYREFHRRDKSVTGYVSTDGGNNYYMEIPVGTTPYLYYSYTLSGGTDKAVGLYFNIANSANKHYYLGQSGLSLLECHNLFDTQNDASVSNAYRALCSSAGARTGIIDLRSLGFKDGDIVNIESLRFYLAGTTTKAVFDYLFFGSETLADSAKTTIAKNSGDAFPWAISHDTFKNATLGTDSQFTFANRINIIEDMIDRKKWQLNTDGARTTQEEAVANYGSNMTYNTDGSLTVEVPAANRFVQISHGAGYDHFFSFEIDKNDLASLRYLNYSVSADPGMRWSIMFNAQNAGASGKVGTAICTWADAYMSGDLTNSSDTVGKSYFREMILDTVKNYWYDGNYWNAAAARDQAWAMFTIPGSQTGCFDLSQIQKNVDWASINEVFFIAYKDPSLKNTAGTSNVSGSVTFNYLYLTSEPLTGESFGTAPLQAGQSYSWPYDAGSLTGDDRNVKFYGNVIKTLQYPVNEGWGATSFYQSVNKESVTIDQNYLDYYSFYYSFSFTDKSSGETAYPPMSIAFISGGTDAWCNYRLRLRTGKVTDGTTSSHMPFGKAVLTGSTTANDQESLGHGVYRMQMPESGAIAIKDIGITDDIACIRVYYDEAKYNCNVHYALFALSSEITYNVSLRPSQAKSLTALSSKVADFSSHKYTIDSGRTDLITAGTGFGATSTVTTVNKTVDLNKTPYLFYSMELASGQTGTFAFDTNATDFHRDGSVSDPGSANLLGTGYSPGSAKYMPQSETGCIDVRAWYQSQGTLPATGLLTVSKVKILLSSTSKATVRYMYFGAEADKTIDLIPSQAGGNLNNGSTTHAWTFETGAHGELAPSSSATADSYIAASYTTKPSVTVKYPGDANGDNFNDLRYGADHWAYHSVCYGQIMDPHSGGYTYLSTGNNQMSGLTINLKETPYLHFSITQPENSYTTFVLQTNGYTAKESVRNELSNKIKPWLSCYNPKSPAGQLIHVSPQTQYITYYKDMVMPNRVLPQNTGIYSTGDFAGVIDLRTWFTETNGYGDIVNLERVRFYTTDMYGTAYTEATVNHFYLSSSSGSAYSVTFEKNDGSGAKSVIQVLKNANNQYVSDETVESFKTRSGYTFVGWYTDPNWEEYFDIKTQPIRENVTLYAGWIKNSEVSATEVNMLANAASATKLEGSGEWELEGDALHIENTGNTPYTMQIEVNKAYSLYDFHSFYTGFDTSKTSQGASIVVDLKSLGSKTYDLLGDPFGSLFLTESGVLTAAPYNKEVPVYRQLASEERLPVVENTNGYVYIKTVTFSLPVGASMHVRYLTAAKSMEALETTVVAPAIPAGALDLLDRTEDDIEQARNVTYELMTEKTEVHGSTQTLSQVHLEGPAFGYLTLGSLYGLGNPIGDVTISASDRKYLYFSVTQTEESKTTFNMWAMVYYKDANGQEKSIAPTKWSTFYHGGNNALGSANDLDNGNIPAEAYFTGSRTGCIDLYEWYSTALEGTVAEGATVTKVRISGFRLYSTLGGANATFNYLAIGGPVSQANVQAKVSYKNASNTTVTEVFSNEQPGQSVNITLDSLTKCPAASDPSLKFKGWTFTSGGSAVYWNPNATNSKKYSSANPGGAWSATAVSGFVQQRADVSYQLTSETAIIYPVFDTAAATTASLKVAFSGSGTVKVTPMDTGTAESITAAKTYTKTYGTRVVLSTTATNFAGWTDASGRLISAANECVVDLYEDTTVTATFGTPTTLNPDTWGDGESIVWLQSSDLTAGTDFSLEPVNNGSLALVEEVKSNIDDTTGTKNIVCYWALEEGQMVQAVTKSGYHWEQLLKDGTTMRVSEGNTYTFVTSPTIKLISVKDGSTAFNGAVVYNEYAVSFDRGATTKKAIVNTQIVPKKGEVIATCGIVIAPRPSGVNAPSYRSAESVKVTANAWNSTTGQFTVDCPFTSGKAYYIRAYAVLRDSTTGKYTLRYGDVTTITF